jgi:protein-tyrosine-phosphatase
MTQPDLSPDPTSEFRILFVCTGNTCRSPLAEVVARRLAEELGTPELQVRSSGTSTVPGLPASDGARRAAHRHGLSLEAHTSAPLTAEMVAWADIVLAMGPAHLLAVRELGGGEKGSLLRVFAEGRGGEGSAGNDLAIPDPFGGNEGVYEDTFQTLERLVGKALERLREEAGT